MTCLDACCREALEEIKTPSIHRTLSFCLEPIRAVLVAAILLRADLILPVKYMTNATGLHPVEASVQETTSIH